MIEHDVAFTAYDLTEISGCLVTMAAAENERSGGAGRGLVALYVKLADELGRWWLALDEGHEAAPVELPSDALVRVDQSALEEALRRLDQMQAHQEHHLPNDEPWRFVIGLLRGHVGAELAMRGGEMN